MRELNEDGLNEIMNKIFSRANVIVLGIFVGVFSILEHRDKIYIISDEVLIENSQIRKSLNEMDLIHIYRDDFIKEKKQFKKFTKIAIAKSANLNEEEVLSFIKKHPNQRKLIRVLNGVKCEYVDYAEINKSENLDYIFVLDILHQKKISQCLLKLKTRIESYYIFNIPIW